MDVSISLQIENKTSLPDTDNPKLNFQLRSKVFLMLSPKTCKYTQSVKTCAWLERKIQKNGGGRKIWLVYVGQIFSQQGFASRWWVALKDSRASASFEIEIGFLFATASRDLMNKPVGRFGPISVCARDRPTRADIVAVVRATNRSIKEQ